MKYLLLFLASLATLAAEEFRTFRMGSTYAWDFQRPNEKTGTFLGVIPASAVFTYDDNLLFRNYPYLTTGFQVGYAMNTFDLKNTDGTRYYTDVSYLVFGLRLGLHYSVMQLVTIQGGMMPYFATGLGLGKPETYLANDWPDTLTPDFVDRSMLLHVAVFHGCNTILQRLIAAKFNVNQTNDDDETPVFTAIHARNAEALRMLVKAKADLAHVNMDEDTPLAVAKAKKFTEGVKILRAAGAKG